MAYKIDGFFSIESAADDAGKSRFLGGLAEIGRCELRPHTMHDERNWTTWHITPAAEDNYTVSVMNDNTWRENYLCVKEAGEKQLALAPKDDGNTTRWRIAEAGDTGIGKSYVTFQNVASGKYVSAYPERSDNVGVDDRAFKDFSEETGTLWQLLQIIKTTGPLTSWIEETEEPTTVADSYT